jgi:hypothetical protein
MDTSTQAAEVIPGKGSTVCKPRQQYRTIKEKRLIVEETLAKGTSVARVARAHGVNANQVFRLAQVVFDRTAGRREPYDQVVAGPGKREFTFTRDSHLFRR